MQSKYTAKDIERILGKIDKETSNIFYNNSRCWVWTASRTTAGYGHVSIGNKVLYMHRVMHEIYNGDIPKGLQVLHHCDNPPCCNPAHLFAGTQKLNMEDMNKKGRRNDVRGEASPKCKLTDKQVEEIRKRYTRYGLDDGVGSVKLAKEFGVSTRHIISIIRGESRK
jgi:hypothetical protein